MSVPKTQSTHGDYLSGLPGNPPWIIMYARPLSVEAVFLVLQECTNSVVVIVVTGRSGYYVGMMEKWTEDLVQTHKLQLWVYFHQLEHVTSSLLHQSNGIFIL